MLSDNNLESAQAGDLVVLDISAATIGDAEKIPSAESKGLVLIHYPYSIKSSILEEKL